jgi:hypothetical protein
VQEGDPLSLGANARRLVDQAKPGGTAAIQHGIEVVHGEADVMDAGAAARDELSDGGLGSVRLEQLDEGLAGLEADDRRTVGIR